jgi:muramoyltetrapeptide carboxypeptidase
MKPLKPPRLRRGDILGLIAPASTPLSESRVEGGVRYLEGLGYRVKLGRHVAARHGYFAGTDDQRADDLNRMLGDRHVRAIFALRGGYGTPRLLPHVDYAVVRRQPKILVGYSDLTALQLALFRRTGLVTFSGPMVSVEFACRPDPFTEEQFWRLLTASEPAGRLPHPAGRPPVTRCGGRAEGRLLGGNLSLLVSSLGTPYSPDYAGALLVLEEVHEHLHRLDRMLTQLRNAGVLARVAGLILGRFTQCRPSDPKQPYLSQTEIWAEAMRWVRVPTVERFPYGHVSTKLTLPLGVRARLDADEPALALLEAAVS